MERAEIQIRGELRIRSERPGRAMGDARDQVGQTSGFARASSLDTWFLLGRHGQSRSNGLSDHVGSRLSGSGPRKILLGPEKPAAHALILCQAFIGALDH